MTKARTDLILRYPDGSERPIRLRSKPLNQGADGLIYAAPGGKLALKLYHEPAKDPERPQKIRQMLQTPPDDAGMVHFAWPIAELNNRRGQFVGYAMPLLAVAEYANLDLLLTRKGRQLGKLPESRDFRIKAATHLANRVAQLHARGHCIVDLKPANMLVNRKTADIVVVDCDGFAIQGDGNHIPAHQYTTGYIAPEAWQQQDKPEDLGQQQDLFALAVIIFQLLNEGLHPYQGIPGGKVPVPGDTQSRIGENLFAYSRQPNPRLKPSPWSLHRDFPPALRQAFDSAFSSTSRRPNAERWANLLQSLASQFKDCRKDRKHRFWGQQCPLCQQSSVSVKVKKPKPRAARGRRPSPRAQQNQPPHVQALVRAYQAAQATPAPQPQTKPLSVFSLMGGVFFALLLTGYFIHLHNEEQDRWAQSQVTQPSAEDERLEQERQQRIKEERERNAWKGLGPRAQAITVHRSEYRLPPSPRVPGTRAVDQTEEQKRAVPHFELGAFDSYRSLPVMIYTPFTPTWEFTQDQPIKAATLDPLTSSIEPSGAEYPGTDGYQMMGWHRHPTSNALYVRKRGFQWNSYTLARLSENSDVAEYKVYDRVVNDGSGVRNFVAPWHFAVTGDDNYLIIAAQDKIRVYAVNRPRSPIAEIEFPPAVHRYEVSDLAITPDGRSIFVGLSSNRNFGQSFDATILEYALIDDNLKFVTDFRTRWSDDSAVFSGSVSVSADGKTLAVGEYRDLETDDSRYTQFGRPVKVRTALPGIQLWRKDGQEARWQRTGNYSLHRRDRILTPDNHAMPNFMNSGIPTGTYRFNINFELSPDGKRLLSGIETEKDSRTEARARAWVFSLDTGQPVLTGRLEHSVSQSTGHKVSARPFARLSNDGTEAVIGWAAYQQSVLSTVRSDLLFSLTAFRIGE